jgi:hypothetical protein
MLPRRWQTLRGQGRGRQSATLNLRAAHRTKDAKRQITSTTASPRQRSGTSAARTLRGEMHAGAAQLIAAPACPLGSRVRPRERYAPVRIRSTLHTSAIRVASRHEAPVRPDRAASTGSGTAFRRGSGRADCTSSPAPSNLFSAWVISLAASACVARGRWTCVSCLRARFATRSPCEVAGFQRGFLRIPGTTRPTAVLPEEDPLRWTCSAF